MRTTDRQSFIHELTRGATVHDTAHHCISSGCIDTGCGARQLPLRSETSPPCHKAHTQSTTESDALSTTKANQLGRTLCNNKGSELEPQATEANQLGKPPKSCKPSLPLIPFRAFGLLLLRLIFFCEVPSKLAVIVESLSHSLGLTISLLQLCL